MCDLQIFDNDEELISVRGKGHCVIPAFYFQTNNKERITSGNCKQRRVFSACNFKERLSPLSLSQTVREVLINGGIR